MKATPMLLGRGASSGAYSISLYFVFYTADAKRRRGCPFAFFLVFVHFF